MNPKKRNLKEIPETIPMGGPWINPNPWEKKIKEWEAKVRKQKDDNT